MPDTIDEGDMFIAPTGVQTAEAEGVVAELVVLWLSDQKAYVDRRDDVCRSLLGIVGAYAVIGREGDEAGSALAALIDAFIARVVERNGAPVARR